MQRYKRVCAFLLAAVLLTSLAPLRSAAEQEGKAEATLYLSTAEDFLRFAENCTLDSYSVGLTVYLRADISLAGTEFGGVPTFGGEFLGGGHTVSGLTITDNISNAGLFRYLQPGATIKELKVIGSLAPSGSAANIGGIVGNNSGLVTGCSFTGSVTGADNVGGIVGVNQKSGTVKNCRSFGYVGGEHYTSSGLMEGCTNAAAVNTEGKEVTLDLENFDLTEFTINSTENVDAYTDAGGIVGYSNGVVLDCVNSGTVGYEHMGYNCGGIAGRQSGYLDGCRNLGTVYGRKEVGGIVGQMEPYTELDPNSTSAENLKRQFSTLSELVNKTLQDTQGASDALTGRLNTVNGYMNGVAEDMGILGEQTSDFVDANIGSVNDITDRVDYVMDGLPDILKDMENANAFLRAALGDLSLVNEDLNIFGKMQGAGAEYDETDYDILTIVSGTGGTVTPDIVNPAAGATVTLTIDVAEGYTLADADLRIQCAASGYENAAPGSVKPKESVGFALVPDDAAANRYYCIFTMPGDASDPVNSTARNTAVYVDFQAVVPEPLAGCVIDTNEGGSVTASPAAPAADALVTLTVAPNRGYQLQSLTVTSADGSAMPITKVDDPGTAYTFTMPGDYAYVSAVFAHMTDRSTVGKARDDMNAASAELSAAMARLENSAAALRAELQKTSPDFTKVRELLGTFATDAAAAGSAAGDLIAAVNTLTNVLTPYVEDAAVAANRDLGSALKNLNEMSGYLGGALTKTREIFEYLNALPDIEFTPLGDDFRENLDSLNANLKGMTDNLNLLNQEFSKYSTIIISDLTAVNNQFNVVMLLLVDVISGVANVTADFKFTDVSEEDAANSTLGKVSGSVNLGSVYGDLNVGGIAGAGIELYRIA